MKRHTSPDDVRQALDHLWRVFDQAGRGSMVAVTRKLGLNRTYFSERRSRPPATFDVGVLSATLRCLDIDSGRFFAELAAQSADREFWEGLEPISERATPAIRNAVRLAKARMFAVTGVDDSSGRRAGPSGAGASAEAPSRSWKDWLDCLEQLRQDRAEYVIERLSAGLDQLRPDLLPRALGIWGSALRSMILLEESAWINRQAVKLARAAGDESMIANLLQRRAHVLADSGRHDRALAITDLATGTYVRLGDSVGAGRTLVDSGMWLHYSGRTQEAITVTRHALGFLPESDTRYRFAAFQHLGAFHEALSSFECAKDFVAQARALVSSVGPSLRGKLIWLEATLSRRLGHLDEAERNLRTTVEIFQGLHYGLTALVTLELAQVLLEQGKGREAWQACTTLRRLVDPLQRDPILGAALVELLRLEQRGLSHDIVLKAHSVVKRQSEQTGARARRAWRALAVAQPPGSAKGP